MQGAQTARWRSPARGLLGPAADSLVVEMLMAAHDDGKLAFFGAHASLADADAFAAFPKPLRRSEWVVYSKKPFGGREAVLAYLPRYTRRVAISSRRMVAADANAVTFKYKDYRVAGPERFKTTSLATGGVHPTLPHPRPAERLPSHPPLWLALAAAAACSSARSSHEAATEAPADACRDQQRHVMTRTTVPTTERGQGEITSNRQVPDWGVSVRVVGTPPG